MCPVCLRPVPTCICAWVRPIENAVDLVILQHPMELANPKGSARLLHLCLARSTLIVGERFAAQELDALLAAEPARQNVLLYPATPDDKSLGLPSPPKLDPARLEQGATLRLIVLDGTWRKSRKMLYLNPALQHLPRLALHNTAPSHYLIRKAQAPDQLSTLEASCYALMGLERSEAKYAPLLTAFDGFVAQQMSYVRAG